MDLVEFNLGCIEVCVLVDGWVNDCMMCVGDYVVGGKLVLVLLDIGLFCIDGYFEEICLCGVVLG